MLAKGLALLGILAVAGAGNAGAATVGDLLITEIMANPAALSDSRGEWFELYNPTAEIIDLRGVTLGDDGGDLHRIESDLLVLPAHFLTLARSDGPGFVPDYVYRDFTLANSSDEIVLTASGGEVLRLAYGAGFAVAGQSRELSALPMATANYTLTLAVLTYGLGDIGTPGRAGALDTAPPAAVPLPGAAWLFLSALGLIASRRGKLLAAFAGHAARGGPMAGARRAPREPAPVQSNRQNSLIQRDMEANPA